ncbi:hypothetical protein K1T71_010452 [Dendrolimus kikuchii]|uniref:Uncharacterized protein n=1 Tax=Dendrolimus kikuchii TaxID=765133 RepID=A0ACC1CS02_9NEOP|nr:hypothetical protein K1T71_010452 [Dendrolimus kikuchii]
MNIIPKVKNLVNFLFNGKDSSKSIFLSKYGVIEDYRETKVLSARRNNLKRHTLTMANVITDSNETRKHMDDRLHLHQDSITKMSYGVVKVCFEMLNATEKLIFTHTWGYRDKNGKWQGIVDHLIKKEADLGRCVTLILFVALTILYAAYSANIVVLLRAPSSSVRSLPDLLNSPLKLGASDFEYNRYFFKKLNDPIRKAIYDKKIAPKGKKPNYYTMEEGVEKVRKGLFAFHMELNPGYRLIQETYQEDEKCDLVEIDYINEIDPWVPGQKRSPFKDLFKISFLKIRESGLQMCLHRRLQVSKPKCSGQVATFSSVGIQDMAPAMLASLYGVLLAPAILALEITYKKLITAREIRKSLLEDQFINPYLD